MATITKEKVNFLVSQETSRVNLGGRQRWYWIGCVNGDQRMEYCPGGRREAVNRISRELDGDGSTGWYIIVEGEYDSARVYIDWGDHEEKRWKAEKALKLQSYKPRRDFQRQRVYDLERHLLRLKRLRTQAAEELDESSIASLCRYIYACLGVDLDRVPKVEVTGRKTSTSTYYGHQNLIKLAASWGTRIDVVLHELAHAIEDIMESKASSVAHGETFVSITMALYELFVPGWPDIDYVKAQLEQRKIKYSEVDYITIRGALLGLFDPPVFKQHFVGRERAMAQYKKLSE